MKQIVICLVAVALVTAAVMLTYRKPMAIALTIWKAR